MNDIASNLAVFCDFENVALGCRDARYGNFDMHLVLERLLGKGKIVVKKAYADWDRYRVARRPMHEASFELIEIPHVSYSGKNSADIRLVVDALDLCYTKSHVDTFVIVSGDSDFSPLVSKLRENNKTVIAVGVKNSSSNLLIENCDEFIYYDDLVRVEVSKKHASVRPEPPAQEAERPRTSEEPAAPAAREEPAVTPKLGDKREALDLVLDTVEQIWKDRDGTVFGSAVKQVLKRKKPNFEESYYGYRTFSELLEDARKRDLLDVRKDEKSGGYVIVAFGTKA